MAQTKTPEQKANEFLESKHLYQLGQLPTEASHPQTRNLSELAHRDLPQAVRLLKAIDLSALNRLQAYLPDLKPLADEVQNTLLAGHRIFLCGCGATGRLSLTLEFLWRTLKGEGEQERLKAFMAGGGCGAGAFPRGI